MNSELEILNENKYLIISFAGRGLRIGCIPRYEFSTYLSSNYNEISDFVFYIDKKKSWYHKGLEGITNNITETKDYIDSKINNKKYDKVIFIGASAGGYAAILFGSLCNVNNVIAFRPITKIIEPHVAHNPDYKNIKDIINLNTKYMLFGDLSVKDVNNVHHISQCDNIGEYKNVTIIKKQSFDLRNMRDNGELKEILDNTIFS